ncbi:MULTISPECIES: Gfo/Idh/MocA family protein [Pontibacillus]|uniref:Gfo/Idh/MocA family oxidoreductase n=1 Tax=Pontibacillus chungwhensis TaxID=265426 RepID=A0ABY8UXB4_9BACI|nr:Gfo/Idh/MocA family oxidoreductase [Pontibacillus chungwhensis]MCD5325702.1 Gfo/Idh/MocA family oxidoreductase [Pontibacillus sp. HN14]WIF98058.1 Gfo/Idh/MocA family oxidoreductase [Pontibacillus chungwhensis]
MRWGILGTANIAKKALIPAIQRTEGAEVVAVASSSGKEQEVAKQFEIENAYNNYEELLNDSSVEAVYIPLPNHLHKEWVLKAAEAGKHILCEKPAALHYRDVEEMIETCRHHNVVFLEAFMYQFHPQHERVKEIIASGEIGDVELMKASFSFSFDQSSYNIRLDPEKGGGALWDVGCYGTHSALHLLGSKPEHVQSISTVDEDHEVDVASLVTMKLENGTLVQVDCSFNTPLRNEYEIIGTKGRITVPHAYRPDANDHNGIIRISTNDGEREVVEKGDQYSLQIEAFERITRNQETIDDLQFKTLENIKLIDSIYQSQNGTVRI